jgi:mono/diheme cytochrome c family protein
MKSGFMKLALFTLIVALLAACGTPPEGIPVSGPTELVEASATTAPTDPPTATDTAAPTDPATATEPATATQPAAEGASVSFTNDILPIFESRCINCHGGDRTQEGLDLKTHASMLAGSENGSVVTPGDAANSLLIELIVNQKMPKRGPKLTPPQVQLITDWVNQGALDN